MNAPNNSPAEITKPFSAPRIEYAGPLLIAGLREPLDEQAAQKIPLLWQQLVSRWELIAQRVGRAGYGLCIHLTNNEYYYMAGCAVWDFADLPAPFSPFIIPSQTYAVFTHTESVSSIRSTIDFAFDHWLPGSGYSHASHTENALHFLEYYGEQFDSRTGTGKIEIWLPVTPLNLPAKG